MLRIHITCPGSAHRGRAQCGAALFASIDRMSGAAVHAATTGDPQPWDVALAVRYLCPQCLALWSVTRK